MLAQFVGEAVEAVIDAFRQRSMILVLLTHHLCERTLNTESHYQRPDALRDATDAATSASLGSPLNEGNARSF